MPVSGVSEQGRATQGVKLIKLDEGDEIAAIIQIDDQEQIVNGDIAPEDNAANGSNDATLPDENASTNEIPE